MTRKYEFTGETKQWLGRTLHQIRAVAAIASIGVSVGDVGGWIESEKNLSHGGNAWVSGNARVYGDAEVYGDARVHGNAEVIWLSHVGSEFGTLTLFRTKDGECVSRGCFTGTLDEFEAAVKRKHSNNLHGQEYALIIQMFRLRVVSWPARTHTEESA